MISRDRNEQLPQIAVIGVSGYGRWHLAAAVDQHMRGCAHLHAVVIPNPEDEILVEQWLKRQHVLIYRDYQIMLEENTGLLDLVMIPTGIPLHTPMTLASLRAGAHVLVEKPLASSHKEIQQIKHAEAITGLTVSVGFQDIYGELAARTKSLLVGGILGPLRRITAVGSWPRDLSYYQRNSWAGRLALDDKKPVLDSPLNNAFAHFGNLALYFASEKLGQSADIKSVCAEMYRSQRIESCDTISLRAQTDDDVSINLSFTHAANESMEPRLRVEGERGYMIWRNGNRTRWKINESLQPDQRSEVVHFNRLQMLDQVLARVKGDDVIVADVSMAEKFADLVIAAHESAVIQEKDKSDIFTAIRAAWKTGKTFAEQSLPWSVPGYIVQPENLKNIPLYHA
ncbi:Gfo/Idh/MocA family oxidoreductase [Rubellicoccus peritrichatus]|uniref:Gfo/Idh/MocA family oxidoreductase n=1 Tax=Rubellicoccus peritrichatus TaxID=3080537 RepID=A0AAQ3L9B7_9BACT|nr:Gfo/Idh/MocA family oxidoreductase [Puniceicoccus sp. CR14]WOO40314.1 Gfo/Idh/MocA family oxidoreductase [Puniceicoccus sp. CR14]